MLVRIKQLPSITQSHRNSHLHSTLSVLRSLLFFGFCYQHGFYGFRSSQRARCRARAHAFSLTFGPRFTSPPVRAWASKGTVGSVNMLDNLRCVLLLTVSLCRIDPGDEVAHSANDYGAYHRVTRSICSYGLIVHLTDIYVLQPASR